MASRLVTAASSMSASRVAAPCLACRPGQGQGEGQSPAARAASSPRGPSRAQRHRCRYVGTPQSGTTSPLQ
eukprot:scaffold58491_cov36-Phaeocystis_antarctica.AAC.1